MGLMSDYESDLDDDWLKDLEKEEEEYDIFYKDITDLIKVNYIYISEKKKIYHIKKETIDLEDNVLDKAHLIYLLKVNENIDDIKWEDSINLFKDINTLYIIYYK